MKFRLKQHQTQIKVLNSNQIRSICRYHVISNPMERKLTMTKAVFIVILIWSYVLPWSLFPYFKIWGRFVPGTLPYLLIALRDKYNARVYDSQRDSWRLAHSTTWRIHLIISFLLQRSSRSATAFQCRWSSTTTAKLWSMYSAMRRHYELKPRKWTLNRCDKTKRVPEQQRLKCVLPKPQSQFASCSSHVRPLHLLLFCALFQVDSNFLWILIFSFI